MDELEIRIVLRYKVPERGLTFNGLLRGLEQDRDVIIRGVIQEVLAAVEEKAIERCQQRAPDRHLRNGRQPRARKGRTSFGVNRHAKLTLCGHRKMTLLLIDFAGGGEFEQRPDRRGDRFRPFPVVVPDRREVVHSLPNTPRSDAPQG